MAFPEQAELIKNQIEATFHSITDGADPETEKMLNNKMQQIKDYFVG